MKSAQPLNELSGIDTLQLYQPKTENVFPVRHNDMRNTARLVEFRHFIPIIDRFLYEILLSIKALGF